MLGKKTGVLFTISSVNFELKQGNEYRAEYILRIPRLSLSPSLSLCLINSSLIFLKYQAASASLISLSFSNK